jgi:hypothetical protein
LVTNNNAGEIRDDMLQLYTGEMMLTKRILTNGENNLIKSKIMVDLPTKRKLLSYGKTQKRKQVVTLVNLLRNYRDLCFETVLKQ